MSTPKLDQIVEHSPKSKPEQSPLERALHAIAEDAHTAPEIYLKETIVPEGGE